MHQSSITIKTIKSPNIGFKRRKKKREKSYNQKRQERVRGKHLPLGTNKDVL